MTSRFARANDSPGFLLWQATLAWQRLMTSTLKPHGLTHVQFVLLTSAWWLGRSGDLPSQRHVADHARLDVMMTSQVVRVLERNGLLDRLPDPADSRARQLRLTTTGELALRLALPAVEASDAAFLEKLDPAERSRFGATLRSLVEAG